MVFHSFVTSPTLFLLFINDLSITKWHIHFHADNSTLNYSITFKSRPSQIELYNARLDDTLRLISELSIISDWDRRNLVASNASKIYFPLPFPLSCFPHTLVICPFPLKPSTLPFSFLSLLSRPFPFSPTLARLPVPSYFLFHPSYILSSPVLLPSLSLFLISLY